MTAGNNHSSAVLGCMAAQKPVTLCNAAADFALLQVLEGDGRAQTSRQSLDVGTQHQKAICNGVSAEDIAAYSVLPPAEHSTSPSCDVAHCAYDVAPVCQHLIAGPADPVQPGGIVQASALHGSSLAAADNLNKALLLSEGGLPKRGLVSVQLHERRGSRSCDGDCFVGDGAKNGK